MADDAVRRAMLAKVHLAKKQLALTDDSYRDVLRRVTGRGSASELTASQLDQVLADFRRLGWSPKPGKPAPGRSSKPQVRMIFGVWNDLCALGEIDAEDPRTALRAFVRRQTVSAEHPDGVAAPEFLDAVAATRVLEGLKAWLRRARAKAGEEAA